MAITAIPTFLIWLIFFLRIPKLWSIPLPTDGMATIVANYDGPLYLIVAKSFYQPSILANFQFPLSYQYYAAHFPFFPLLIRSFAFAFGYPYSMLFSTLVSSVLALFFFNKLARVYFDDKKALFLTFVFGFLPARWLIVRSVGSAEPFFVAAITASIYYFDRKKYLWAGLWGALAQLTKSPAILLFISYFTYLFVPHLKNIFLTPFTKWLKELNLGKIYPIFFIPVALILVFVLYKFTYNDFFVYFHSGDNIHLFFPPFQIFNYSAPWVGTFWLEEIIFVYLLGAVAFINLIKNYKESIMPWFFGVFFLATLFVAHRDVIRYALPLVPFALLAFSNTILKKEFRFVIALLIIPIFLFSLAYISQNVMPISNWAPFL